MGIRFSCPNGHKLNVKAHLAGKRAICPHCGSKVVVPNLPALEETQATAKSSVARATSQSAVPTANFGDADVLPSSILPHTSAAHVPAPAASSDALPDSILAATFGEAGSEPATIYADSGDQDHRAHGRRNQLIVSVVLLLIVVLLALALYWVLTRNGSPVTPEPSKMATPTTTATTAKPTNPAPADVAAPPAVTKPAAPSPTATPASAATGAAPPGEPTPPQK